jgi:translation initiation factor 2 subunit 2
MDFSLSKKKKKSVAAAVESDSGSESDEFDFGAKKKKGAKKAAKASLAFSDSEGSDDEFDFGKKKKKKDGEASSAGPAAAAAAAAAGEDEADGGRGDGDYTYEELVERAFASMDPDSAIGKKTTLKIKPPQVAREGTKKTVWTNFTAMCKSMNREEDHVLAYVFAELGTHGSLDGTKRLVIKGRFQPKQMENVIRHYISEYVQCATCRGAKTTLKKENRLNFICCQTCGSTRTVATVQKGYQAIVGKRRIHKLKAAAAAGKTT